MFMFKNILILSALLFSPLANAEFLNCDLKLDLIEDTDSSELKEIFFQVELNNLPFSRMDGSMNTISCFGTFLQDFHSNTAKVSHQTVDGFEKGEINDARVSIGNYHYQFKLKFAQQLSAFGNKDLVVSGKVIPLDNEGFIHQIASGTCYFAEQRMNIVDYLDRANDLTINFNNNQRRDLCH